MKTDTSLDLYEKYFSLKNKLIEIELKDKTVITGKIISYVKGNNNYISKWEITKENALFGLDSFGFLDGQLINHKDILKVTFLEDNVVMGF